MNDKSYYTILDVKGKDTEYSVQCVGAQTAMCHGCPHSSKLKFMMWHNLRRGAAFCKHKNIFL